MQVNPLPPPSPTVLPTNAPQILAAARPSVQTVQPQTTPAAAAPENADRSGLRSRDFAGERGRLLNIKV